MSDKEPGFITQTLVGPDRAERIRYRAESIYRERMEASIGGRVRPDIGHVIEMAWEQARAEEDKFDALEAEEREEFPE